jgi:NAD(P)-dependent dehydrogenase (short-subunit alcohol dehydrogenase family)
MVEAIKGKNVIVTGAAVGLGFVMAMRFAQLGANVVLADVAEGLLTAAAARLASRKLSYATVAVEAGSAGEAMVERCIDAFGSVDALINNAMLFPEVCTPQMTPAQLEHVARFNLRELELASQVAARRMVRQKHGGAIVNVGGDDVMPFTRSFALELAPHDIKVNAIILNGSGPPLAHAGVAEEDLANATVFLASANRGAMTGSALTVEDELAPVKRRS